MARKCEGDVADEERQRRRKTALIASSREYAVNPSRIFILRPVATSLFMVAILLAGLVAYRVLPLSALPEVDYPTIQVVTLYPGASPDVVDLLDHRAARAAVRADARAHTDVVDELRRRVGDHAPVQPRPRARHRRAAGAGRDQRGGNLLPQDLPTPPLYSKVNPADTPILTLAVTSKSMPMTQVQNLVDTRLAQKISQIPGVGLVSLSGGQRPAVRVRANPKALAVIASLIRP